MRKLLELVGSESQVFQPYHFAKRVREARQHVMLEH